MVAVRKSEPRRLLHKHVVQQSKDAVPAPAPSGRTTNGEHLQEYQRQLHGAAANVAADSDAGTKDLDWPSVPVVDLQLDPDSDVMAGTALASVTDLMIDPFNPKSGEVGDLDSFVFEDSPSGAGAGQWDIVKNGQFGGSEFDAQGRLLVGTDGGDGGTVTSTAKKTSR